jgi:hypothetical protein
MPLVPTENSQPLTSHTQCRKIVTCNGDKAIAHANLHVQPNLT